MVANYVLWPAAHFINFKFVPTQVRSNHHHHQRSLLTVLEALAGLAMDAMPASAKDSKSAVFTVQPVSDIASPAVQHRILYNNIVSIFWNAFLSTLSHAPTIEPTSFMDSFQQYADTLPAPLHERAAEFVDSIYKTSLPLHERAAEFAQSLKLPLVCATGFPPVLMLSC